jgi:predicted dithiol-disulfide oxidoreductase (DUF899 family)
MNDHRVVSREEWTAARINLLAREKELTRVRDEVSQQRRELPWVRVEKEYVFEGPNRRESLAGLFDGRSQLLVYHFMFDPSWTEGCKSCSFWADNYAGIIVHLAQRDVTMVTVSQAPLATLEPFKRRMGWQFKWVSSHHGLGAPSRQVRCIDEARDPVHSDRRAARGSIRHARRAGIVTAASATTENVKPETR